MLSPIFSAKTTQSSSAAADSLMARPAVPVPLELRREAESMSFEAFSAKYTAASGPLRLGSWQCTDADRSASRLGPQARNYRATIAVGDRIGTSTAAASGPIAALTAMLHDCGIAVELLTFRQVQGDGNTTTFVRGSDGAHDEWAMGWSTDPTRSALRAVVECANRLLARRL